MKADRISSKALLAVVLASAVSLVPLARDAAAAETLVETLSVDSRQVTPTFSTNTLAVGVTYRIEASGTWFNGSTQTSDAEFGSSDGFQTLGGGVNSALVVYGSSLGTPIVSSVNGTAQDVAWGTFNPSHVYSIDVLGDGGNIGFVIDDSWATGGPFGDNAGTFDNSGILRVRIFRPTAQTVAIDIKPGSFPNSINLRTRGVIPVAILTAGTFDANTVDPTTVRFGATGTEAAPVQSALEDVDGDGDLDMILHFRTQDTGIVCGGTAASLTGQTTGGQVIEGSDSIKTVGCA